MEEIHYRIPTRVRGAHPGFHRSGSVGAGYEFREHETLLRSPDPRRIDLRASLNNPFGDLMVRVFNQRAAIAVSVVADLSASMGVPGPRGKLNQLSRLTRLLGYSVSRTGDRFGFIGCDEEVRTEFLQPPARRSGFSQIADRLDVFIPDGIGARGLAGAGRYLRKERGLVFLVSDYLFPKALLAQIFGRLARHVIVPVMLSHPTEINGPAAFGFVRAVDSETGRSRTVLLRPSLRRRIRARYLGHRCWLESMCVGYGLKPLVLAPEFTAEDITRYFYPTDRTQ